MTRMKNKLVYGIVCGFVFVSIALIPTSFDVFKKPNADFMVIENLITIDGLFCPRNNDISFSESSNIVTVTNKELIYIYSLDTRKLLNTIYINKSSKNPVPENYTIELSCISPDGNNIIVMLENTENYKKYIGRIASNKKNNSIDINNFSLIKDNAYIEKVLWFTNSLCLLQFKNGIQIYDIDKKNQHFTYVHKNKVIGSFTHSNKSAISLVDSTGQIVECNILGNTPQTKVIRSSRNITVLSAAFNYSGELVAMLYTDNLSQTREIFFEIWNLEEERVLYASKAMIKTKDINIVWSSNRNIIAVSYPNLICLHDLSAEKKIYNSYMGAIRLSNTLEEFVMLKGIFIDNDFILAYSDLYSTYGYTNINIIKWTDSCLATKTDASPLELDN